MSVYNKVTNNVADAVSKIMNEKIHPNQQKLDVHEPEKDKLTAHDFKKLRAKKEMETGIKKEIAADRLEQKAKKKMEEEAEQLQEYQSKDGVYKHQGTYGRAKDMEAGETDWDKEDKLAKGLVKKKKGAYGPNQNRRTNTKLYTEMLDAFKTGGIKGLFESIQSGKIIVEEPTEDEFNAELDKAKAKASGKAKQAEVSKASVQAVQNEATELNLEDYSLEEIAEFILSEDFEQLDELTKTTLGSYVNKATKDASTSSSASANWAHTSSNAKNPRVKAAAAKYSDDEASRKQKRLAGVGNAVKRLAKEQTEIQVINADLANGVDSVNIAERELTGGEMKKKEEIVMSMKKGIEGFKDRYGDKAKEVMYATATSRAKKD